MTEPMTPYQLLGGEGALESLVERFYFYMDTLPEAAQVRQLHGKSLQGSKQKLFKFLSGWLGGPDLFVQEFGHPRLRMRHLPFVISTTERDQWMLCMQHALNEMSLDGAMKTRLTEVLQQLATHMINQEQV